MDWLRPKRLMRETSSSTRPLAPKWPLGAAGIGGGIDAELDEADGVRAIGGGGAGLRLEADAVDDVPAAGLVELEEDVFAGLIACRVLNGGGDLIEESEVVELALGIEELCLIEGLARLDED